MFPCIIGINEKFVNLNSIAVIEDESTDKQSIAKITTTTGDEIELFDGDAELLFDRCDLIALGNDSIFAQLETKRAEAEAAEQAAAETDA